jgi:hypothetical protein
MGRIVATCRITRDPRKWASQSPPSPHLGDECPRSAKKTLPGGFTRQVISAKGQPAFTFHQQIGRGRSRRIAGTALDPL